MRSVSSAVDQARARAASPSSASTCATASTKPTDWNCTVERFTATGASQSCASQRSAQWRRFGQRPPSADRQHQALALGHRMNWSGAARPALRVVPAQQRLAATSTAVAQTQLRLEVELELAALGLRVRELALEHQRGVGAVGDAAVEELVVARPLGLARYIALSAFLISSSGVRRRRGRTTPIDGVTEIGRPSALTGTSIAASSLRATSSTSSRCCSREPGRAAAP